MIDDSRLAQCLKLRSRVWWACVRGPFERPLLFATRADAAEARDTGEYIIRVYVEALARKHRLPKGFGDGVAGKTETTNRQPLDQTETPQR